MILCVRTVRPGKTRPSTTIFSPAQTARLASVATSGAEIDRQYRIGRCFLRTTSGTAGVEHDSGCWGLIWTSGRIWTRFHGSRVLPRERYGGRVAAVGTARGRERSGRIWAPGSPASRGGDGRGYMRDWSTGIGDRAICGAPTQEATGVDLVMVNGRIVWRDGKYIAVTKEFESSLTLIL
jgi:hypothetical protein